MEDKTNIRLTAAEMSGLWTQYINDTLVKCITSYFLENVSDEKVRPVIEFTLNTANQNLTMIGNIFKKDHFPIPVGFTDEDVNIKAPKLFSDTFMLMYLRHLSILTMAASSAMLGVVTRRDVVEIHKVVLKKSVELQDRTRDLMLEQGTYIRPPFISIPDKVDFVEKQQFLTGFFGKKRSLSSVEITHLFLNIQTNYIGKTLITGLAQVAEKEEVKQLLLRGKKMAQKHVEIFSKYLLEEDLPAPMGWDTAITDTTAKVFSDKLIVFHVSGMIAAGVGNYGAAMAASPRRDIGARYASLVPEVTLYAEDCANLMIKKGWMEEPPQTDDRDGLIKGEPLPE
ncbi:DUF3231 family protein [Mesobacillus maritimus]|uniref:DUF3231 family protein n=1 Tax=Mesobacillus maritimus TaxID=1643336 RepID=A0ABS7KAM9_9BACI|nr:DUF3231 family protein [Mesobacillus maritimus]MBY0099307.1 DUF3231 family protein [Mesobacillus maritimus]